MKRSKESVTGAPRKPDLEESGFKHVAAFFVLSASIFLAYSVSLHGTWAMDDSVIGQFGSIENILKSRIGYREIAGLSFEVNRWINPLDPLNYRVLNLLIHLCNSVLVYFLAFLTLRLPRWSERFGGYSFPVALFSGVVFALHPLNINAVAYIVQRMTSLATMFVLLALFCYIFGRTAKSRAVSAVFYFGTLLFVVLGIFSKENAVMAMFLIPLYDYFFLIGAEKKSFFKRLSLGLFAGLILLVGLSPLLGIPAALSRLFDLFLYPNVPIPETGWTAMDVYWTPAQHILTEFRVVGRYLMLFVAPLPGLLVFDWWGFPLSNGISVSSLTTAMVIFALIGFALWKKKRLPFLSFGILWYFVAISLESFVAVGSDLYFEHRNYLPLTGLIIGVTAEAVTAFKPGALGSKRVWVVALVLAAVFGFLTFERNLVWKDSVTLWQDTVRKAPGNLRALIALGNAYLQEADFKSAETYYEEAMRTPDAGRRTHFFRDSSFSLGMAYLFSKDLVRAKRVIDAVDSRTPGSVIADIMKGLYDSLNGDASEALRRFDAVLPRTDGLDRVIVYTLRGDVYRNEGVSEKALESYDEALEIAPSFAAAYYGIGSVYLAMGKLDRASFFMGKTLALNPDHALALSDAADISMLKKEPIDSSLSLARRAIANSPPFALPYVTMGNVLIVAGRDEEADEFYRLAVKHGMKGYMVLFAKARAYSIKGENQKAGTYLRELAAMKDLPESLRRVVDASLGKK